MDFGFRGTGENRHRLLRAGSSSRYVTGPLSVHGGEGPSQNCRRVLQAELRKIRSPVAFHPSLLRSSQTNAQLHSEPLENHPPTLRFSPALWPYMSIRRDLGSGFGGKCF